jgi:hypothetical protein
MLSTKRVSPDRRDSASPRHCRQLKRKDYRIEGRERFKVMTLAINEFIRRFLIHVLPDGFHRIRYYGLFANGSRADNITKARELLAVPTPKDVARFERQVSCRRQRCRSARVARCLQLGRKFQRNVERCDRNSTGRSILSVAVLHQRRDLWRKLSIRSANR